MIVDLVTLAQVIDDPASEAGRLVGRADVLLKDHEFIAAEPRHEILRPQHRTQPIGDRAQQLVAAGMAQGIIDLLELIEVDKQQCRRLLGIVRDRQQTFDFVAEVDPVRKPGQFVEPRQMRNPGFRVAPFGDVLEQHDGAAAGHRLERP